MLSFYPFSLFLSSSFFFIGEFNYLHLILFLSLSVSHSVAHALSRSLTLAGYSVSLSLSVSAASSQSYIILSLYPSIHLLFSVSHASGVHTRLLFCVHFIYLSFWITLRVRCCVTMFLCYFKGRILMLHLLYFLVSRKIVSMILIYPTNVNQWWLTLVGPPLYIKI